MNATKTRLTTTLKWLKASVFLVMMGMNWLALILVLLPLHLVSRMAIYFTKVKWSHSLFLAEDHLVNAIMGGHFMTTLSAEIGNMQTNGSDTAQNVAKVVNRLFYWGTGDEKQKDHCRLAMQADDIYVFSSRRAIVGTVLFQTMMFTLFNALIRTYGL